MFGHIFPKAKEVIGHFLRRYDSTGDVRSQSHRLSALRFPLSSGALANAGFGLRYFRQKVSIYGRSNFYCS